MPDETNKSERKILQGQRWPRAVWILILVVTASTVLAFIGGTLLQSRCTYPSRNACIANLRAIHGAKCSWALENKKNDAARPTASEIYGPRNYIREEFICPSGGTYTLGDVGTKPRCSVAGHTL